MAIIITRDTGATAKNSPLSNAELDNNFINLNGDIATRIPSAEKGAVNGIATLDGSGKVPATQLPSYVDDVIEFANLAGFPATGETGKIYIDLATNKTYRWSGSVYVGFNSGAVDSVAGRVGIVTLTSADIGLANVENKSSATIRGEITSSNVTAALGFTPLSNATSYLPLSGGTLSGGLNVGAAIGSRGTSISVSGSSNSSAFAAKSSNYDTVFGILPHSGSWTYLSTGIYYNNDSWVHASADTNNALLGFNGGSGAAWYASNNSSPSWNVASAVSLWNQSGTWIGALNAAGGSQVNGNTILHAGNYNSYALPLGGGILTGTLVAASGTVLSFNAGTTTADSYNYVLQASNDTGAKLVVFVNGSTRSADGGVNASVIRSDGGPLVLGSTSYNTNILGSNVTIPTNVRIGAGNASPNGTAFSHTIAGVSSERVVNFDGNGGAPSVWWTNGATALFAIDGTTAGALFWANSGGSWQQQMSVTYGTVNVNTTLQQGGNQVLHAGNYTNYAVAKNGSSWTPHPSTTRSAEFNTFYTDYGYIQFGPANGSWAHIYSDKNFYFNQEIWINNNRVLDASNYTSYAPSLTGSGASGTWGINVTGTAGSISGFNNPTTAATANTIAYRDSGGDIYGRYMFAEHFNQSSSNSENPSIAAFWTNSGSDNYNRKSTPAHVISQLGLLTTSNYSTTLQNNYMRAIGYASTSNDWNALGNAFPNTVEQIDPTNFSSTSNGPVAASYTYGLLVNFSAQSSAQAQVYISHAGNDLIFRGGWNGTGWNTWNKVLTNQNYTSYSPSLTGSGASGTWGINVTGYSTQVNLGNNSSQQLLGNVWAGTAGYPGYQFTGGNSRFGFSSTSGYIDVYTDGNFYAGIDLNGSNNLVLHAGNYSSYALPLSGGTMTGTIGSGVNDLGRIFQSYNTSASSAAQFFIDHSYGSVNIGNPRGSILIQGSVAVTAGNVSSYAMPASGIPDNSDTYVSFRVMRNNNSSVSNDGMYIGYGNTNSGITRIYGGGATSGGIAINGAGVDDVKIVGNTVLNGSNYNNYSPTLTGGNASGTWGINVSGSAGSVAWGNVSSKPSNIMYYQGFTLDANTMDSNATGFTYAVNAPAVGPVARFSTGGGYDLWLNAPYSGGGNQLYFRTRNGDAGTINSWKTVLHDGNYTSYALPLSGGTLSGTLTLVSGVSWQVLAPGSGTYDKHVQYIGSDAYTLEAALATDSSVAAKLPITFSWRGGYSATGGLQLTGGSAATLGGNAVLHAGNYGSYALPLSGGTVTGQTYFQSNLGATSGATSGPPLQAYSTSNNSAFMSFHKGGHYAVNMGLDSDNVLRIGGWSASAGIWQLDMGGNNWAASSFRAPIFYDSDNTGYYTDPNGSSSLENLTNDTYARLGLNLHKTNRRNATSDANYFVGSQGWNESHTWDNVLNIFGSTFIDLWGPNRQHPQGNAYTHAQGIQALHYRDGASTSYGWQMVGAADADSRWWLRGKWSASYRPWYEIVLYGRNVGGDLYANNFYSSSDTAFYVNPSALSRISSLRLTEGPFYYSTGATGQFIHDSDATPVAFSMTKAGNSVADSTEFGVLNLRRTNHSNSSTTVGASLFFELKSDSGGLVEYAGITGRKTVAGASGGQLNFHNYGRNVVAYTNADELTHTSSVRAPIFYDSGNTGYYIDPASTSKVVSVDLRGKIELPSGAGNGGAAFSNYHYSMGVDIANNSWSHPHYSDLIIGYHTGIRLGAGYSGIRFYNNSPTTDANNDGNGDGVESLLMTIGGYIGTANHTDVLVNNNLFANSSMRSPTFYDSNNTTYYFDGAGTSLWNASTQDSNHTFLNYGAGITGTYSAERLQAVFAMGAAYRMSSDGGGAGNLYGLAWSHPNAGSIGGANNLNDHGLLIINNGSFRAAISSRAVFSADVRGTLFYDYNDTGYYVDPASTSLLNTITATNFRMTNALYLGANNYYINNNSTWFGTNASFRSDVDIRATIFYDSADTTFYLDPAATGTSLNVAGAIIAAGNITAYSDERLKSNWKTLDKDFVENLAEVLSGTFTRTDNAQRQAGVGAQSLQKLLPEAVVGDDILSVAYGNAALVSAVELAKRVVEQDKRILQQDARIAKLEALVAQLLAN
jgi:hypothetical protein